MNVSNTWLVLALVFLLFEAVTVQLVSLWFIIGAIFALITSLFIPSMSIQICIFVLSSVISLLLLRPFLKSIIKTKPEDINLGRYISKKAIVTSEINNVLGVGEININGSIWLAQSINETVVAEGEIVLVEAIEGVTCKVKRLEQK
ncbi:MAG: NfeD family protein [Oscillospiraceae bacterium]